LKPIPTTSFDMLPLPIMVVELNEEALNHTIVYLNQSFINIIGWDLADIPDKNHWWQKAYPDPHYQKVVESLWELSMESIDAEKDSFVTVTVNIQTKRHGVKRFKVYTELKSALMDGYYVVAFEEINESLARKLTNKAIS
jgi:PAS domain-containing protein